MTDTHTPTPAAETERLLEGRVKQFTVEPLDQDEPPVRCGYCSVDGTVVGWFQVEYNRTAYGMPACDQHIDRLMRAIGEIGARPSSHSAPTCSGCDSDTVVVTHALGDGSLLQVAVFHDDACPVLLDYTGEDAGPDPLRQWINAGFLDHTHDSRTGLLTLLTRGAPDETPACSRVETREG